MEPRHRRLWQSRKTRRRPKKILIGGGRGAGTSAVQRRNAVANNSTHAPMPGPSQCHPRIGHEQPGGGCLPEQVLRRAAQNLNLPLQGGRRQTRKAATRSKATLLHRIAKHLGINPANQRSLLNALPLDDSEKRELAAKWLRPPLPPGWDQDPDMWLDSNNIRDVMNQYQEAKTNFRFMGPYPIDFAAPDPYEKDPRKAGKECLIDEMCELDLKKEAARGIEHIGFSFNLDPHYKDGSHWVAAYINIPKKQCYYFDSYGMKPPKQIYKFMQWLTLQEPNMELGWNGRRFQRKDSECGMFSMYFLDRMMNGEPFLKFCRRQPPDSLMLDLRDWVYST
jgi:hypothetical protein